MIDEIFIINNGGIPLFYKCYDNKDINPALVSSLFSALSTLAESSDNELDEVMMSNQKYIFSINKFFLITIRVADSISKKIIINKLKKLEFSFLEKFRAIISQIKEFNGEITQFDCFENDILELFEIRDKKVNKLKSSEILGNFLGIKKKINYKRVLDNL